MLTPAPSPEPIKMQVSILLNNIFHFLYKILTVFFYNL
jgi:hypothetical protein